MSVPNLLNLPEQLGAIVLKWSVAKYIEGAGPSPANMLARAQTLKAIASELSGLAAGTVTVSQIQTLASSELTAKGVSVSNQLLIQGLLNLLQANMPVGGGLIQAALAADVNVFLADVTTVAGSFGA